MKFKSQDQIEKLAEFRSEDYFTTSFFLDTSRDRMTKKEIEISLKNLISRSYSRLEKRNLDSKKKESMFNDLKKIQDFCSQKLLFYDYEGLSLFSCSGEDYWKVFNLVRSPRNMVIFDRNPYVRPLSAILEQYHRICALVMDRKEARWYDIYMGEINLINQMETDLSKHKGETGREGFGSQSLEKHLSSLFQTHIKKVSNETFELFKKDGFDWLFIGAPEEYIRELESYFHPYLKERMKGVMKIKPSDSTDKVLKEALKIKEGLKEEEEEQIVKDFESELKRGGLAVSGIRNTLRSLNKGEVKTLLVSRKFSKPGRLCPQCRLLFLDEAECPTCKVKTIPVIDVIDEAVESAFNLSCQVRHINSASRLDRYGSIGAFLRYKS
jgi:peptide subunit release factor 1 (eRF1)